MAYFLSVGLFLLNIIFAKSKRYSNKLGIIFIIFMWVLFWSNTNNPDFFVYKAIYQNNANFTTQSLELGFILLVKLGNFIGASYHVFLMLITFVCFYLIHSTLKKITKELNLVYAMYFIFPFFFDVIQLRNFIVMSILIYSTKYLLNNNKVKYIIAILIASSFQIIAIAYLPFVIINVRKRFSKSLIRFLAIASIFLSVIILINSKQIPFLTHILEFMNVSKLEIYFNSKTSYGFLLFWGLQILSYSMMWLTNKLFKKYNLVNIDDGRKTNFIQLIYYFNLISFIFLPLFLLNSNFIRLIRNILILNYTSIAITYRSIDDRFEKMAYLIFIIIYVLLFWGVLLLPSWDNIVIQILDNNMFFH